MGGIYKEVSLKIQLLSEIIINEPVLTYCIRMNSV